MNEHLTLPVLGGEEAVEQSTTVRELDLQEVRAVAGGPGLWND
jgi:hypothetical protein